MILHKFTHAKTGTTVYIAKNMVYAWYEFGGSVHILASGGAAVPVKEDVTYVTTKLEGDKNDATTEGSNDSISGN